MWICACDLQPVYHLSETFVRSAAVVRGVQWKPERFREVPQTQVDSLKTLHHDGSLVVESTPHPDPPKSLRGSRHNNFTSTLWILIRLSISRMPLTLKSTRKKKTKPTTTTKIEAQTRRGLDSPVSTLECLKGFNPTWQHTDLFAFEQLSSAPDKLRKLITMFSFRP